MGKKYLNTKEGSIEQSVLDVWQEAAEMHAEGMDGRTKEYRSHRGKLESNRVKRENKKNSVKTEQPETLDGSGEHAYEIGTDRYAEYTAKITPGQIEEEIAELNALIEELEEGILGNIAKAAGKTVKKVAVGAAKKVGGAVQRGRAKRRLRALVDQHIRLNADSSFPHGYDLVFIARYSVVRREFSKIGKDFEMAISGLKG